MELALKSEFYIKSRNRYDIPNDFEEYDVYKIENIKIKEVQEFLKKHKRASSILIRFIDDKEKKLFAKKDLETYIERLPLEAQKVIKSWKVKTKSPYSLSFYNTKDVSWNHKKEGSLRISNHWNFTSCGEKHCKLNTTDEYISGTWILARYNNGIYEELRRF